MLYLPWGESMYKQKAGEWSTEYLYTGQEQDPLTDLYYYGARYYDPSIGLFLNIDPLTNLYPGFSAYSYVANNPIKYHDPTGMKIEKR